MKYFLFTSILLSSFALFADDSDCLQEQNKISDLELIAIDDKDIITAQDILFCENLSPGFEQYAHVTPEELPDNGSVWRTGNRRWNDEWEKKYQRWFSSNITIDTFSRNGLNFPTDCADAALMIRAIFARIHNLPVQFAGELHSNSDKKYQVYPTIKAWNPNNWEEDFKKDIRFQKALAQWNSDVGTINLYKDTYPIDIVTKDGQASKLLTPGTILLDSGHVGMMMIDSKSLNPYKMISSSAPVGIQQMSIENFFPITPEQNRTQRGILWWNWSHNCGEGFVKTKDKAMPGYEPQYNDLKVDFNEITERKKDLSHSEFIKLAKDEIDLYMKKIESLAEGRISSIERNDPTKFNYLYFVTRNCLANFEETGAQEISFVLEETYNQDLEKFYNDCLRFPDINQLPRNILIEAKNEIKNYDNFSTPSRDQKLQKFLENTEFLFDDSELSKYAVKYKRKKKISVGKYQMSLSLIEHGLRSEYLKSEPWHSADKRWGINRFKDYRDLLNRYVPMLERLEQNPKLKDDQVFMDKLNKIEYDPSFEVFYDLEEFQYLRGELNNVFPPHLD